MNTKIELFNVALESNQKLWDLELLQLNQNITWEFLKDYLDRQDDSVKYMNNKYCEEDYRDNDNPNFWKDDLIKKEDDEPCSNLKQLLQAIVADDQEPCSNFYQLSQRNPSPIWEFVDHHHSQDDLTRNDSLKEKNDGDLICEL